MPQTFLLDGVGYNVHVTKLTRKFAVLDSDSSGRTQNGQMYRDVIGTFYNYEMTVQQSGMDTDSLDAFWEAISQPAVSHVCEFPYGQQTLTQRMYVTSGEQDIRLMTQQKNHWGEIQVSFIAMDPKVMA